LLTRIEELKLKDNQKCKIIIQNENFKSAFNKADGFDDYLMLLKELAKFAPEIPDAIKKELIQKAIWKSADDEKLHESYVGNILKRLEAEYLEQDSQKYYLITAISITGIVNKRLIKTKKSLITISKNFPKKFKNSYNFKQVSSLYPRINQEAYSWVTVEVTAKCIHSAAELALEQLDYFRGIFNICFNYNNNRTSFNKPSAINKIIKYPYHSLHLENGNKATQLYWFDPNYSDVITSFDISDNYKKAKYFYLKLSKGIENSKNSSFFIKALNQYCSALDTSDMNNSFLALWSLLETLTFTLNENYDVTITRTLVLFTDKFKLKLELETLRKKRNMAIHSGSQFEEAEKYAYMLMNIIHEYIFFLINAMRKSKSIEQLKSTLDLPMNKNKITEIRQKLKNEVEKLDLIESLINIEKN